MHEKMFHQDSGLEHVQRTMMLGRLRGDVTQAMESPRPNLAESRRQTPHFHSHHLNFHKFAHHLPYRLTQHRGSSTLAPPLVPIANWSFRASPSIPPTPMLSPSPHPPSPLPSLPSKVIVTKPQVVDMARPNGLQGRVVFATFATISMREFLLNWVAGVRSIGVGTFRFGFPLTCPS